MNADGCRGCAALDLALERRLDLLAALDEAHGYDVTEDARTEARALIAEGVAPEAVAKRIGRRHFPNPHPGIPAALVEFYVAEMVFELIGEGGAASQEAAS